MTRPPALQLSDPRQRTFGHVLLNTLVVSVVNFTVWFGLTFWVYLETRSVLATGMVGGVFVLAVALTGVWFGSLVDHHGKRQVMQGGCAASLICYAGSLALYLLTTEDTFRDVSSPVLWIFVVLVMLGVIAGNLNTITLPTLVTLLIPPDRRDRANGLVGTATGVSFLVTSVISGLLVAAGGMRYVLLLAIVVLALAEVHLWTLRLPQDPVPGPVQIPSAASATSKEGTPDHADGVDLRGTIRLVRSVPGLPALILFSCFNNFLGGVFMALLDAYGLSMVAVQVWGLLWGAVSVGIIVGGLVVARTGLGRNPVRALLLVNVVLWAVTVLFPVRTSIVLLAIGMAIYMFLVPFAEAAEQTILQKVVPYERQGRVFGFAQSVEQAASPVTAFLIGPITQLAVIPWMTTGAGAQVLGPWFGTGPDRGLALVFVVTGLIGLAVTLMALGSRYYRQLSTAFLSSDSRSLAPDDSSLAGGQSAAAGADRQAAAEHAS